RRPEKTPAMIKLPEGKYRVRLELPGYEPVEDEVEVRDQAIRTFRVEW
ncbi:MAG TPA: PEGA domain-containing protein, partial [Thermopetrobacter sp.]|nr:PEGA domain-containing protein [Thermopetrobacter sp.]